MTSNSNSDLLKRFSPVLRFTRGEQFFPTPVEDYVRRCSLWVLRDDDEVECLVPEGELTLKKLAEQRANGFQSIYYLQFIEPLNIAELASYRLKSLRERDPRNVFRAGRGRLARVGYGSRFVDALFSLSLFARGRVPGDTAASAAITYQRMRTSQSRYVYYGRVLRWAGWIVLQYWYFYPFNNWRSGFYGVNDHEADWEMACIYLYEEDGEVIPEWVAYASHDFSGDDLRRRWDDPELQKVGEHPVVFVGAGSHASYFSPGEYLAEVELQFLYPLVRLMDYLQDLWRKALRQAQGREDNQGEPSFNVFRIPFVDYARGDGLAIGCGQESDWEEPILIEPPPPWVLNYRGLWGLYAKDPISGENAPAGPRYNRDGTVRQAWYDPIGWSGLDNVLPPDKRLAHTLVRANDLKKESHTLEETITEKQAELLDLGVESEAMRGRAHMHEAYMAHQDRMESLSNEIDLLRARKAEIETMLETLHLFAKDLQRGVRSPPRAHIQRVHKPGTETDLRFGRLAEVWAAISIGLMMVGFVGLVLFARDYLAFGLVALVSLIVFVEASFRRRLPQLITSLTIGLAIISAFILLFEFFWEIVVTMVLLAGGYIMWENARELWQ